MGEAVAYLAAREILRYGMERWEWDVAWYGGVMSDHASVDDDHNAAWFAGLLEMRIGDMGPREKTICVKLSRGSATLLAKTLRLEAQVVAAAQEKLREHPELEGPGDALLWDALTLLEARNETANTSY